MGQSQKGQSRGVYGAFVTSRWSLAEMCREKVRGRTTNREENVQSEEISHILLPLQLIKPPAFLFKAAKRGRKAQKRSLCEGMKRSFCLIGQTLTCFSSSSSSTRSKKHLVAVLHFRGVQRGREFQLILRRLAEVKKTLGSGGDQSRLLFTDMPVTVNTSCLASLPVPCLSLLPRSWASAAELA